MKQRFKQKKGNFFLKIPWTTLGFLSLVGLFWIGLTSIETTNAQQQFQSLEQAIIRSAVHCYAVEGAYPSELAYLEENYQLEIDHERFIVHYDGFAANIVPEIIVIARDS